MPYISLPRKKKIEMKKLLQFNSQKVFYSNFIEIIDKSQHLSFIVIEEDV